MKSQRIYTTRSIKVLPGSFTLYSLLFGLSLKAVLFCIMTFFLDVVLYLSSTSSRSQKCYHYEIKDIAFSLMKYSCCLLLKIVLKSFETFPFLFEKDSYFVFLPSFVLNETYSTELYGRCKYN